MKRGEFEGLSQEAGNEERCKEEKIGKGKKETKYGISIHNNL